MAFDSSGNLYASETPLGRVSRINTNGTTTPVLTGLVQPEGVVFDAADNMYVVEDVDDGRVMKKAAGSGGTTGTEFAGGLNSPEGIIWVDQGAGILYVTESNIENTINDPNPQPDAFQTYVTSISSLGVKTRILTTSAVFTPNIPALSAEGTFWSYTDLVLGSDDLLYLANELSGRSISGTIDVPVPPFTVTVDYEANSTGAVFTTDPAILSTSATEFADDSTIAPEGLTFSSNGNFPLYMTEEDISNDQSGVGRLSRIDASGNRTDFCTGFSTLEDIVVDENGWLYVIEDLNGIVIQIRSAAEPEPEVDEYFIWLPLILR
ncbi:MAG: hypothetical protein KDJ52_07525 [Anaerolineae bacterium]|nr:hypothetical protein [Anaerolineae bacterium]